MSDPTPLTLDTLSDAVARQVALRARLTLQPAGGPGTKVFPPTYVTEGAHDTRYATERRRIGGEDVACVLLDSVASQANRMELALQAAWDGGSLDFPLVWVDFREADARLTAPVRRITALEAPHRIYDAILRDSVDAEGTLFRATQAGRDVTDATPGNATALYRLCPTALVFGAWDSTGPRGGLGSKFPRALSSEIVGIGVQFGTKVGGRLDPLGIQKAAGPVKADPEEGWVFEKPGSKKAALDPSEINHGNVAPSRDDEAGGVTFDHALQTTVLSLAALRRLRFPADTVADGPAADHAARTALAALAVAAVVGAHADGHDLRSGTLLVGDGPLVLEVVAADGRVVGRHTVTPDDAANLVAGAARAAAAAGLPWKRDPIPPLRPADKLVALLARSQELEAKTSPNDA